VISSFPNVESQFYLAKTKGGQKEKEKKKRDLRVSLSRGNKKERGNTPLSMTRLQYILLLWPHFSRRGEVWGKGKEKRRADLWQLPRMPWKWMVLKLEKEGWGKKEGEGGGLILFHHQIQDGNVGRGRRLEGKEREGGEERGVLYPRKGIFSRDLSFSDKKGQGGGKGGEKKRASSYYLLHFCCHLTVWQRVGKRERKGKREAGGLVVIHLTINHCNLEKLGKKKREKPAHPQCFCETPTT